MYKVPGMKYLRKSGYKNVTFFVQFNETVQELNALIFENILSSNHQTDATSQTGYVPEEKDLECELSKKNRKLERSGIKIKELELALEMKELKIEDENRKVSFVI